MSAQEITEPIIPIDVTTTATVTPPATTEKGTPILSASQKKWGCGIIGAIWLIMTTIMTVASVSVLPIAADVLNVSGGWVNAALISTACFSFFVNGFIVAGGMFMLAVFGVVGVIAWGFFTGLSTSTEPTKPTE